MIKCPNCAKEVDRAKPGHETGCVLGALLTVIEDREDLDLSTVAVEDIDADAFWNTMGRIVDDLELLLTHGLPMKRR